MSSSSSETTGDMGELSGRRSYVLLAGYKSDLTIKCGDITFNAHKIMLASDISESNFFKKALQPPFRESQEGLIDVTDHADPAVVLRVLFWMYDDVLINNTKAAEAPFKCFPIDDPWTVMPAKETEYLDDADLCDLYVQIFALATMWDMPKLKYKIASEFGRPYENVSWFASIDRQHDIKHSIIRDVYSTTDEIEKGLRDAVVRELLVSIDNNPSERNRVFNLMRDLPGLAFDVATCDFTRVRWWWWCANCEENVRIDKHQLLRSCRHKGDYEKCRKDGCNAQVLPYTKCYKCKVVGMIIYQ